MKKITRENVVKLRQMFETTNTIESDGQSRFGVFVINISPIRDDTPKDIFLSPLDIIPRERSSKGGVVNQKNCPRRDISLLPFVEKKQEQDRVLLTAFATCMSMFSTEVYTTTDSDQIKNACMILSRVAMFMKNNGHATEKKYYFYFFLSFLLDQCLRFKKFQNIIVEKNKIMF